MTGKSWQLSRRDVLKGAGVALALPYLNAMAGVASTAPSGAVKPTPKRFVGTYISYGVYQPEGPNGIPTKNKDGTYQHHEWGWWPQGAPGVLASFNKSSAPFKDLRDSVTYLRGLDHKGGHKLGGHSSGDVFLTGANMGETERAKAKLIWASTTPIRSSEAKFFKHPRPCSMTRWPGTGKARGSGRCCADCCSNSVQPGRSSHEPRRGRTHFRHRHPHGRRADPRRDCRRPGPGPGQHRGARGNPPRALR